ncbi:MAG: hypothetical protein GWN30_32150, partial [Gammaproteobacteria bacterium]|nr:hypothetical protein [Gammaproteobacteria bacterium]
NTRVFGKIVNGAQLYSIVIVMLFPRDVFAYLDPGTGSLVIQAIIAIFIGAGLFIGHIRIKVSRFFSSLMKRIKGKKTETDPSDSRENEESSQ